MAWSNDIFYITFISQIFILSYYFPKMLLARMRGLRLLARLLR